MTVEDIEKLAKSGTPMPDTATLAESLLYHNLRRLYWEYRNDILSSEQGKIEKHRLVQQFGVEQLHTQCGQQEYDRWRRYQSIQAEAEKNGCEICKRIVRTLDGREQRLYQDDC